MASRAQPAARGVARFLAKPRTKPTTKGASAAPTSTSDTPSGGESGKATPSLKIPELLVELEDLFKQLGVRLTYEALGGELGSGGLCKVKGQFRIIIDRRTTPSERVAMLLPLLLRFEIDALPRSATLRDLLSRLRPAAVPDDTDPDDQHDADATPAADVAEHIAVDAEATQALLAEDAVAQGDTAADGLAEPGADASAPADA